MRRDQHIGQLMEGASRGSSGRFGGRGILPPDIQRGATEMPLLKRVIDRILIDDRSPRDVDRLNDVDQLAVRTEPITGVGVAN
jgi:hypothetical protein